jgi:phosphoglycolate phosphatase
MPKLVLFDIDETMVSSHGAGRRALERALSSVYERPISLEGHSLSGKTDPQICFEALADYGFETDSIVKMLDKVFAAYLPALQDEVTRSAEFKVHVGVVDLLEKLKTNNDACLGLLTGNIEPGAKVKLARFGLHSYFAMGAFGSDSHNRMELPAVAHKRGSEVFKREFEPSDLVIIGDARNDVLCAKGYGAKSIAVATGKTTKDTLAALEPDYLFDSLEHTASVVDAIFAK